MNRRFPRIAVLLLSSLGLGFGLTPVAAGAGAPRIKMPARPALSLAKAVQAADLVVVARRDKRAESPGPCPGLAAQVYVVTETLHNAAQIGVAPGDRLAVWPPAVKERWHACEGKAGKAAPNLAAVDRYDPQVADPAHADALFLFLRRVDANVEFVARDAFETTRLRPAVEAALAAKVSPRRASAPSRKVRR